jgi:hypothetical protein
VSSFAVTAERVIIHAHPDRAIAKFVGNGYLTRSGGLEFE